MTHYTRSLGRCQCDVAELDLAVVALEVDRAGLELVAVQGPAGDAFDFLVVDDGLSVVDDGHVLADEGDVEGLPFAGGFGDVFRWGDPVQFITFSA